MMKPLIAAAVGMLLSAPGAALADGGMAVPLPDTASLSEPEAQALLAELARVNVITSNCPAYAVSDAEWSLITGTGDQLAQQLGLDAAAYDQQVYGPAFKQLDDPQACDRIGPSARPLLARLKAMGGAATAESESQ